MLQYAGARRERVDVQHAAGVRDLHHAAGAEVAAEGRRPEAMARRNAAKAGKLYAEIDRSGFYRGHAEKDSRSRMNVTFRLPSEELEKKFAKEATAAGLDGLKGHRSVGGMRASIYNAFPESGVDALVEFMQRVRAPERLATDQACKPDSCRAVYRPHRSYRTLTIGARALPATVCLSPFSQEPR